MQRALGLGVAVDTDQLKIMLLTKYNARLQSRLVEKLIAGYDITEPEYWSLLIISGSEGETCTPSVLGEMIGEGRTNITRICNVLVKKGLMQREVSSTNRRMVDLTLTTKGKVLLREIVTYVSNAREKAFERISPEMKKQIVANLLTGRQFIEDAIKGF